MGDDIQAIKAGILEIADILVVNKADRPGVENTERALRTTLELAHPTKRISHHGRIMDVPSSPSTQSNTLMWIPPILKTVSTEGKGFGELAEALARHVQYLHNSGDWAARDRARLEAELESALRESLIQRFRESVQRNQYEEMVQQVLDRNISPHEAVNALLDGASNRTS
jgi:LAO/AO transport system kinase